MNALLESLISLVFIYLLLSLLVSFLTEAIQKWLKRRGKMLKKSLDKVMCDPLNKNFSEMLYDHPVVWGLRKDENHLPSYISANTFAATLIDLIGREGIEPRVYLTTDGKTTIEEIQPGDPYESFVRGCKKLNPSDFRMRLEQMTNQSRNIDELRLNMERWYTEYQEMVSSLFKASARKLVFVVAAFVTLFLNVDSIGIFRQLQTDEALRQQMVAQAEQWLHENPELTSQPVDSNVTLAEMKQEMVALREYFEEQKLAIGWKGTAEASHSYKTKSIGENIRDFIAQIVSVWGSKTWSERAIIFIGWLITTMAISFGAPFWFDMLNRVVNIRSSANKKVVAPENT